MDAPQFDHLTLSLTSAAARRGVLRGLAGTTLGLIVSRLPGEAESKKRRRKHTKRLQTNAYGCVDVGRPCRGKDANCCSGICQGKKPKKGQKDKSHCVAHDEGGCPTAADACVDFESTQCPAGGGLCYQTTGKGSICGGVNQACATCKTDADCVAQGFGDGAGCVVCPGDCPVSGGTSCVSPPA